MRKLDEFVRQAKRLSAAERRRLVDALEAQPPAKATESAALRLEAMEKWLALAGTAHSAHTDVSSDKYPHLAATDSDDR